MNGKLRKNLKELMLLFEGSFINYNFEVILNKQFNIYFRLEDVESRNDLNEKLLWWISRSACKGVSEYRQKKIRSALNEYLKVDFNQNEWECIYCKLGNKVNIELTQKFTFSNYNLDMLKGECNPKCDLF